VKHRKIQLGIFIVLVIASLAILGYMKFFNGNLVYFTTGLDDNTVFKVADKTATKVETEVLISDAKNQYEDFFGENVWSQNIDGISFEDYAKNQIKSKLIRIKCMNVLADERGVVLDRTESANVDKAAKEYMAALTSDEISSLGVSESDISHMFTEFAIAQRLFNDMTSQVAVEVSADQARVITIQYICADSSTSIDSAKARIAAGDSFFFVARETNSDGQYEYELKRGEMDPVFEDTAFNLKTGETSNMIQAGEKYYLIKCISDNNKTKTDSNKNSIVSEKKLKAFNDTFESYEASLYVEFNENRWGKYKLSEATKSSANFENIFDSYFK